MTSRLSAPARREQLLDVALEVFAHTGYHDTSMNDVAEAAGVTKPVLYQHFESKRELFQALEDGALEAGIGAPLHGAVEDHWRYAQAATVSSGTIEIQRMIVSKALLAGGRV